MKSLARWLLEMECKAAEFYLSAAHRFAGDPALSKFLKRLAEDESEHYRIMLQVADLFDGESLESPVSIDEADRRRLESSIQKAIECCSREEVTRTDLLEYIFLVEFSELNDIFLYVTNWFGNQRGDALRSVSEIERHRKVIQHFFESTPEGKTHFQKMRNMQPVWQEKILVVDDSAPIASLLKAVLRDAGEVEIAVNGQDALEKTKQHYYRIIVSDVDMPIMDGLNFYRQAIKLFPGINKRFLFLTGDLSENRSVFFQERELHFMEKPAAIADIKEKVYAMMGTNL